MTKPLAEFSKRSDRPTGYRPECKKCFNAGRRQFDSEHPDLIRQWKKTSMENLKKDPERYQNFLDKRECYRDYPVKDFTYDMYLALYEKQGGVCAICLRPETVRDNRSGNVRHLAVDHDHETGEVRGLLCFRCNTRLHILENKDIKNAAQSYLSQ
jgi:hypothetical protein